MEAAETAITMLAQGKRNMVCGEIPNAVNQFQEACKVLWVVLTYTVSRPKLFLVFKEQMIWYLLTWQIGLLICPRNL